MNGVTQQEWLRLVADGARALGYDVYWAAHQGSPVNIRLGSDTIIVGRNGSQSWDAHFGSELPADLAQLRDSLPPVQNPPRPPLPVEWDRRDYGRT